MKYEALAENAAVAMQYDLLAMAAIARVYDRYVPWSNASLRPAAIQITLNEILLNRRKVVVELGCGISTAFMSAAVASLGGHLVAIDHEPNWITQVQTWLEPDAAAGTTFVHAPLADHAYADGSVRWYDAEIVATALKEVGPVELVVIDGPPAYLPGHHLARGPALHVLKPYLAPSAAVILDDLNRPGEQQIARDWSSLLGTEHRDLTVEAGVARWHLGSAFNVSY
jgi:predicted O-methyltransferase YrrM